MASKNNDTKPLDSDLNELIDIDKIVHEPARLLIMANLFVIDSADFLFLLNQTNLTRGNLSSHLSKLEKAGYISISKEFVGKIPRTVLSLTKQGREAFQSYRDKLEEILRNLPG